MIPINKKPGGFKFTLLLGVACGAWGFISGDWFYGILIFTLSVGLFNLWNWARIATFLFSLYLFALNGLFLYGTWLELMGYKQTWALIGVISLFPFTIFCIFSIIFLTRSKVKEQFKKQGKTKACDNEKI